MNETRNSLIRDTIRTSTIEGIFAQIFMTISIVGSIFITKLALIMNATPNQLSLLSSAGQLTSIFQLFGIIISNRVSTMKETIIRVSYLSRGMMFIIGALPFLLSDKYAILLLIILCFASTSLHMLTANMWIEWIATTVPHRYRGRFFSIRQQYIVLAGSSVGLVLSILIDAFDKETTSHILAKRFLPITNLLVYDNLPYVFLFIFSLSVAFGYTSLGILKYQYEEKKVVKNNIKLSCLKDSFRDRNFRMLLLFSFWWMAAVGIGQPFWTPFMINKLNMSLYYVQLYGLTHGISSMLFMRFWGRIIDKYGNKTIMFFLVIIGGINSLMWLFVRESNWWIIFIEAASAGFMWSGAGIVSLNLSLAVAPKNLSQLYSGFYGAVGGLAMTVTILLSGIFYPAERVIFGLSLHPEQILFACGGIARISSIIPLIFLKEPQTPSIVGGITYFNQYAKLNIIRYSIMFKNRVKHYTYGKNRSI